MVRQKLGANFFAVVLGFVPVALLPFDDPLLLTGVVLARKLGGFYGGYLVFCLVWFAIGLVALVLYEKSIEKFAPWINKLTKKFDNEWIRGEKFSWKNRIAWLRYIAHQTGADATFILVLVGPFLAVPFVYSWGYRGFRAVGMLLWSTFLAGTIWYWWYAGVIWNVVHLLTKNIVG